MWLLALLIPHAAPPTEPAHLGRPRSAWIADLHSPDDAEALEALEALAAMGSAARPAVPAIAEVAFEVHRYRRVVAPHARAALLAIGIPPVPALMERIQKASGGDKLLALRLMSLHGPGARPAIPLLIEAVRTPPGRTTTGAEDRCISAGKMALQAVGPAAVEPALDAAVNALKGRPRDAAQLRGVLGNLGAASVPPLVRLLRSESPADRRFAVQTLHHVAHTAGIFCTIPAIETLRRVANDDPALAAEVHKVLNTTEPLGSLLVASITAAGSVGPLPAVSVAMMTPTVPRLSYPLGNTATSPVRADPTSYGEPATSPRRRLLLLVIAAAVVLACIILGQVLRDRTTLPRQRQFRSRKQQ